MNVFISWSGDLSKEIAEIFREWMPSVIQNIKPYFTPADIEKGSKWESEISKKLSECTIGIVLMTKSNLTSSWIMFEVGALSNKLDKSRVCPILIDVSNSDLTGPLSTFQTTIFNSDDIKKLMMNINNQCGDNKLNDSLFNNTFNTFWPALESKVSASINNFKKIETNSDPKLVRRSDRELLEEILELTRMNSRRKEDIILDRGIKRYEDLPYTNKQKLKGIVEDYLRVKGIKLKDYETLDKKEICEYLEKDFKVRELAGRTEVLMRFLNDFLNQIP